VRVCKRSGGLKGWLVQKERFRSFLLRSQAAAESSRFHSVSIFKFWNDRNSHVDRAILNHMVSARIREHHIALFERGRQMLQRLKNGDEN